MKKLIIRIRNKVILFVSLMLFTNLNLSAQYKLELEWQKQPVGGSSIASIAITNNDSIIYLSAGTSIYKVRTSDAEIIKSYPIELAYPWFLMSKDEKTIIVATGNAGENGMGLLDPETYKRTFWVNYPNFTDITYNDKQNKFVVNYSPDIRIFDVVTQKLYKEFNTGFALNQASLTDDGKYLVYSYRKYTTKPDSTHYFIRILDMEGKIIKEFSEIGSPRFTFTTDGKTLIYVDKNAIRLILLSTLNQSNQIEINQKESNLSTLEVSSDDKFMLIGYGSNSNLGIMYCDIINKEKYFLKDIGTWINFKLNSENSSLFFALNRNLYKLNLKPITSVINEQNKLDLSLNLNDNKLILTNPQNHHINTLTAYDILGRTYPLSANGNEVDVSALAAGKYFLKVGLADDSFMDFSFVKE